MKKLLAIFILSLFYITPSNASKALCITNQGNLVTFKITWFDKDCKGYALKKKINKKLFKRISWWATSLGSGNNYGKPLEVNSANLVGMKIPFLLHLSWRIFPAGKEIVNQICQE